MFSIEKYNEDGFEKIGLKNNDTGNVAVVIPSCSAMLHEFSIIKNNERVNVIQSYASKKEFDEEVIDKGYRGCKLSPFVCRLFEGTYHFGDKEYRITKSPWRHALHGELYDRAFEVVSENAGESSASVTMKYAYREEDPGYPFNYDCIVTWQLEKENKLSVTTESVNKDRGLIPMQDGWHPYFTLGDSINDLYLEFQSKEMVEFSGDLIPTKKLLPFTEFSTLKKLDDTKLDNCFTLDTQECQPLCVLRNADKNIEVQILPQESYPYLQIYTPGHRKSIAIENLSGAPDAFNNAMGFITLEPGQSAIYKTSYKINILNKAS